MELILQYNNMIKDARRRYFSELISFHHHNPRFLFRTADQLVNPATPCVPVESDADCEMFLNYFTDEVKSVRASITPNATYLDILYPQENCNQFYLIAMSEFLKTVTHMRVSSSPLDVLPTKFLSGPASFRLLIVPYLMVVSQTFLKLLASIHC